MLRPQDHGAYEARRLDGPWGGAVDTGEGGWAERSWPSWWPGIVHADADADADADLRARWRGAG